MINAQHDQGATTDTAYSYVYLLMYWIMHYTKTLQQAGPDARRVACMHACGSPQDYPMSLSEPGICESSVLAAHHACMFLLLVVILQADCLLL
jgi:hypothetical protein